MGIHNLDLKIGMKVSIYLTWIAKNSEFFWSVGLRGMAVLVTGRFATETEIFRLWHEGLMVGVQCQLMTCRGPF